MHALRPPPLPQRTLPAQISTCTSTPLLPSATEKKPPPHASPTAKDPTTSLATNGAVCVIAVGPGDDSVEVRWNSTSKEVCVAASSAAAVPGWTTAARITVVSAPARRVHMRLLSRLFRVWVEGVRMLVIGAHIPLYPADKVTFEGDPTAYSFITAVEDDAAPVTTPSPPPRPPAMPRPLANAYARRLFAAARPLLKENAPEALPCAPASISESACCTVSSVSETRTGLMETREVTEAERTVHTASAMSAKAPLQLQPGPLTTVKSPAWAVLQGQESGSSDQQSDAWLDEEDAETEVEAPRCPADWETSSFGSASESYAPREVPPRKAAGVALPSSRNTRDAHRRRAKLQVRRRVAVDPFIVEAAGSTVRRLPMAAATAAFPNSISDAEADEGGAMRGLIEADGGGVRSPCEAVAAEHLTPRTTVLVAKTLCRQPDRSEAFRAAAMLHDTLYGAYDAAADRFLSRSSKQLRRQLYAAFLTMSESLIQQLERSRPVRRVCSPVLCAGGLFGSFKDLLVLLQSAAHGTHWSMLHTSLVLLGNYADVGEHGVEVVMLLCAWAFLAPEKVHLLRGPHEDPAVNGNGDGTSATRRLLRHSCNAGLGQKRGTVLWQQLNRVFAMLPVAAMVDETIFVAHGGLPRLQPCPIREEDTREEDRTPRWRHSSCRRSHARTRSSGSDLTDVTDAVARHCDPCRSGDLIPAPTALLAAPSSTWQPKNAMQVFPWSARSGNASSSPSADPEAEKRMRRRGSACSLPSDIDPTPLSSALDTQLEAVAPPCVRQTGTRGDAECVSLLPHSRGTSLGSLFDACASTLSLQPACSRNRPARAVNPTEYDFEELLLASTMADYAFESLNDSDHDDQARALRRRLVRELVWNQPRLLVDQQEGCDADEPEQAREPEEELEVSVNGCLRPSWWYPDHVPCCVLPALCATGHQCCHVFGSFGLLRFLWRFDFSSVVCGVNEAAQLDVRGALVAEEGRLLMLHTCTLLGRQPRTAGACIVRRSGLQLFTWGPPCPKRACHQDPHPPQQHEQLSASDSSLLSSRRGTHASLRRFMNEEMRTRAEDDGRAGSHRMWRIRSAKKAFDDRRAIRRRLGKQG